MNIIKNYFHITTNIIGLICLLKILFSQAEIDAKYFLSVFIFIMLIVVNYFCKQK